MRKLLYLLLGAAIIAGGAAAVRYSGVDVAAVMNGALNLVSKQGAPQGQQAQGRVQGQAQGGGQRANRGPAAVETAKAESAELSDDIEAIGTLLADRSVQIAPETSGRLASIMFEDGAEVAAGKPLFQLDPDLANAALAEARARLELAEGNFARNQSLRKSGNVAQSTFEAAQTERDVARAAVDSAEVLLRKLTITAPFGGVLGFRAVSEGAYVTAGTPLVQLDKVDHLKVSFSVPELQQALVRTGQTVEFTADALPEKSLTAIVSALNPSLDVNGRALQVRADFDNAKLALKPGLLVRVTVKGTPRNAVLLPEAAIVRRGENAFVYTIAENTAKEVRVRLGVRRPGKVEVLEGIAAGDTVVTAGHASLRDGATVEVVSASASAE